MKASDLSTSAKFRLQLIMKPFPEQVLTHQARRFLDAIANK
jgi:hypothetical protein